MQAKVIKEGWLKKKSPQGVKGFRSWQLRYVVVDSKALRYYKDPKDVTNVKCKGIIMLLDLQGAECLPDKRLGGRFDVHTKKIHRQGGSTYQFDVPGGATHKETAAMAREWVEAIGEAIESEHRQSALGVQSQKLWLETTGLQFSALQHLFFQALFTPEVMGLTAQLEGGLTRQEQDILARIRTTFSTNEATLRYILQEVMDPEKGQFVYDTQPEGEELDDEEAMGKTLLNVNATKGSQPNGAVVAMLLSTDFKRHLCTVFADVAEAAAHQLGVRVLWALYRGTMSRSRAVQEFSSLIGIHFANDRFTRPIFDVLVAVMCSTPAAVTKHLNMEVMLSFRSQVVQPSVWPAVLIGLKGCEWELRASLLKELNVLMHDSLDNVLGFAKQPNWPHMILNVLADIPLRRKAEEPLKSVIAYATNMFILMAYRLFLHTDKFESVTSEIFTALYSFTGNNAEGAQLAAQVLSSISSKLAANKAIITISPDSHTWLNLKELHKIMKHFVFQTAFWGADIDVLWEEQDLQQRIQANRRNKPPGMSRSKFASQRKLVPSPGNQRSSAVALSRASLGLGNANFLGRGTHSADEATSEDEMAGEPLPPLPPPPPEQPLPSPRARALAPRGTKSAHRRDRLAPVGQAEELPPLPSFGEEEPVDAPVLPQLPADAPCLRLDFSGPIVSDHRHTHARVASPSASSPAALPGRRHVSASPRLVKRSSLIGLVLAADADADQEEVYFLPKRVHKKREHHFWNAETIAATDYGFHWAQSDEQECADIPLLLAVKNLFAALKLDSFDPAQFPSMDKDEKDCYVKGQRMAFFWRDADELGHLLTRHDIANRQSLTYHRFGNILLSFLERNITDVMRAGVKIGDDEVTRREEARRRQVMSELKAILEGEEPTLPVDGSLRSFGSGDERSWRD